MLHLIFVALRAAILRFEIPRCRIIAEITVEILGVTVPQMGLSGLLAIWVGSVGDINELPVDEVSKKGLIGLSPLLCFGGCLRWHLAKMGRVEQSSSCVVV